MQDQPFNPDDADQILRQLGIAPQVILHEALHSGWYDHCLSRERDIDGFLAYRPTTLANMLVDRIYPHLTDLIEAYDPEGHKLKPRDTNNGRATELWCGAALYAKVKRVHDTVRRSRPEEDLGYDGIEEVDVVEFGLPSNVPTKRVLKQLYPQVSPLFPNDPMIRADEKGDAANRLCLICAFDLDLTEENIQRPRIGVCDAKKWLWTRPLPELETDAIARLSPNLGEKIDELRKRRQA